MGKIVLVTVAIGNDQDITSRALSYLNDGEYFFVEDTRSFKVLLKNLNIDYSGKKIDSFHDQTESHKIDYIMNIAKERTVYIVSEAGSPYLSDPAYPLVKAAIENNISVVTTGGINSVTYSLELSGFPANPFSFYGFISRDQGARLAEFAKIGSVAGTHIYFEGVSRVDAFLTDLSQALPGAHVAVARELSKTHESIYRFKAETYEKIKPEMVFKGEFVILIYIDQPTQNQEFLGLAEKVLEDKGKKKTLAKLLSRLLNRPVNDIYAELGQ